MIRQPTRSTRTYTLFPYSTLVRAEEIVATARALLINTHDSLSTAFSTILFKVATEPDIAKQFYESADSEVQMSRLIEEILRIEPPVRALSRVTTKAVTVGGTDLPEGAHLLILFASGNDDERSEEHTSELQSLMSTSDAVFSL